MTYKVRGYNCQFVDILVVGIAILVYFLVMQEKDVTVAMQHTVGPYEELHPHDGIETHSDAVFDFNLQSSINHRLFISPISL